MKYNFIKHTCLICIAFFAMSCEQQPNSATRVEKILSELNDPDSKYVLVISHRGDWRNYPENTIPAIESVIRMGADMMELDIKRTKDSVLVLMHDKTIDRMTDGTGLICDYTYDSLMTFKIKGIDGGIVDTLRIPTLREALICCKDRILVNVDHAYLYYDEILELTEELGVTGQVLMKGRSGIDKVNEDMSKHVNNLLYMPVIDINTDRGQALFSEYVEREVVPMAFEICWNEPGKQIDDCVAKIHQMGSKLWVNTLWPVLCGGPGNGDDAAFEANNPADVYGRYIEMGATMLQTDRPELLLNYLRSIGRHD